MAEGAEVRAEVRGEAKAAVQKLVPFLRHRLTPRFGLALSLWRLEAATITPLALLLVATLGRWSGALAMGSITAAYAAAFLFLLEGDPLLSDVRAWITGRRLGRLLEGVFEGQGWSGTARRAIAVPFVVMLLGPFWRAVTFHLFRMPRWAAWTFSVAGSIPHSLLWTGLVLGGLWEGLVWPFLKDHVI